MPIVLALLSFSLNKIPIIIDYLYINPIIEEIFLVLHNSSSFSLNFGTIPTSLITIQLKGHRKSSVSALTQ